MFAMKKTLLFFMAPLDILTEIISADIINYNWHVSANIIMKNNFFLYVQALSEILGTYQILDKENDQWTGFH